MPTATTWKSCWFSIAGIDERSLEYNLHLLVRISQERLHRVGSFPEAFRAEVIADTCRYRRMFQVEEPMRHVNEMHHQFGENASTKFPKPASVAITVVIERLVGSDSEKTLPIDGLGINPVTLFAMPRGVPIPSEMYFADSAKLSRANDLIGFASLH